MIIAVDPGNTTGVAIFAGSCPAFAKVDRPTVEFVHALLSWGKGKAAALGRKLTLVIEDQHAKIRMIRRGGKMMPTIDMRALKVLLRHAEVWRVVADLLGIPWVRALASEWQGPMLRSAPKVVGGKQRSTKHRAQWVVRNTWDTVMRFWTLPELPAKLLRVPSSKVPIDPCDAILIGRWFQLHGASK